ncbi:response regulator [Methanotrichaceae archaeon M04Ac]|jgi:hypothetical protein|uniref:Response regulator n=1 Tax=Candidatus Methanocrinis alkalitolerans TaxID=3033395 RepID=A0ABT5XBY5_9EURY|nr:response regulator [Candidatus Methanocrinis alkalitolerans]MDF0592161.1 response regulator [Candidatus Methanocrinis alkalitolerans]
MREDRGVEEIGKAEESFQILLVEDDNAHAMIVMRSFERLGFSGGIDWVRDGNAALDYLRRRGTEEAVLPRLAILDLRLPKVDGHQVLSEMKSSERLKTIPVVVLTTSTNEEDLQKARSHQVNGYLTKPLRLEELQKIVEEVKDTGSNVTGALDPPETDEGSYVLVEER